MVPRAKTRGHGAFPPSHSDDGRHAAVDARMQAAGASQRGAGLHIGYWIGRPHWGRGYMTEAARGLIAHLFATRDDALIHSGAFVGNAASLRVQDKLGFARDGESMMFSRPHGREIAHVKTALTLTRLKRSTERAAPEIKPAAAPAPAHAA